MRNEFFEAEIDPATGGLRAFRDPRTRVNRLGHATGVQPRQQDAGPVGHASRTPAPALGEVMAEGDMLDDHDAVLATFRQRLRAWVGRPVLELRIELDPVHPPAGYPWHAYYGARFAWRDERAALFRGVNGANDPRPRTPGR